MKYLSLFLLFLSLVLSNPCFAKEPGPLRVLTYSSLKAKGGWGTAIEQIFRKDCKDCQIEWVNVTGNSSLLGRLRAKKTDRLQAVLGLEGVHYSLALQEQLLQPGRRIASSPYAIIVDTQRFPKEQWPKKWSELPSKLGKELLVPDPRLSSAGTGWVLSLFLAEFLQRPEARKLEKKIFPNWSSAYEAFTKGLGKAVWSYRSSEAYHRCEEKSDRYQALPLEEGYPVQEEWAAALSNAQHPHLDRFLEVVSSPEAQVLLPTLNWMWPEAEVPLPECFKKVTPLKTWQPSAAKRAALSAKTLRDWLDRWAL